MRAQIDIGKLFLSYEKNIAGLLENKQRILEDFKKKEDQLKRYREAISDLEKIKNEINFALFEKESEEFLQVLLNFDTEDIPKNIDLVYSSIAYLENIRYDLEEVSKKYIHIKNFWENYAIKKYNINEEAVFAIDIRNKLSEISEDISIVTLDEMQRLEDKIEEIKAQIERSISMITDMKTIVEKNIFIGDDEVEFYEEIVDFIQNKYSEMSLAEVSDFSEKTNKKYRELVKKSKTIKKKIPIYKMISKNGGVYSYAMEPKEGIKLNISDIDIENPIYIETDRFIYIINYPEHGIFTKEFIQYEMEIPDEYFDAIKEFDRKTTNYFIFFSVLSLLTAILNIIGVLPIIQTLLLVALYPLIFMFIFRSIKKKIDKKYKFWKMFHFFETNFYFIKEGDSLLKPQNIIPLIVMNFEKLFKVPKEDFVFKKEDSKKEMGEK